MPITLPAIMSESFVISPSGKYFSLSQVTLILPVTGEQTTLFIVKESSPVLKT